MSVSCVCASDNTTATVIGDASHVTVDTGNTTTGTYDDLNNDIQSIAPNSTYNVTKNYKFNGKGQTIILGNRVIVISQDNIIINGNGHVIDAGGSQQFAIFKVTGNNVTINNLKFINSEPGTIVGPTIYDNARLHRILSPISWCGNDPLLLSLFGK